MSRSAAGVPGFCPGFFQFQVMADEGEKELREAARNAPPVPLALRQMRALDRELRAEDFMSTSPASPQVLSSTVLIVTCNVSSLYMHVCDKTTCSSKIACTSFQVKRVSNTRAETACDKVPHCALCTVHYALSTKLMQLCHMYAS